MEFNQTSKQAKDSAYDHLLKEAIEWGYFDHAPYIVERHVDFFIVNCDFGDDDTYRDWWKNYGSKVKGVKWLDLANNDPEDTGLIIFYYVLPAAAALRRYPPKIRQNFLKTYEEKRKPIRAKGAKKYHKVTEEELHEQAHKVSIWME